MAKIDDSVKKKVPELRFKGFTDEWEERKFKDNIVSIQTGTNLLGSAVNEGTPLIKMGNLQRGYFSFKKLEYLDSNSNVGSEDIVNYGDFLFNTRNTLELVGKGATWTGISGKYAFNSNIARFKFDGIDTIFFNYLYNTQQVISQVHARAVGTTSVSAVYPRDLNSLLYYLPSIEEQQKIGSFFKQLDKTIALHQRKLDLLKEQKKGYLQKMFPKNGAKVPELRFAGFADDWEQCKLSDITKRVIRKNKNLESTLPLTISAQEGLIDQNEFFNKTIASRDVSGYYLIKNGEFAYNKSYSNGYPWGAVKRLNRYNMGVLSTLYIVFKPTNIDSDFLEKYYDTTYWHKEISKHAAEGARNHGLLNIAATDFFKTELVISKSLEEQQKIGSFFQQLDNTITLHQLKLDLLKEQKKGFLQKMFA